MDHRKMFSSMKYVWQRRIVFLHKHFQKTIRDIIFPNRWKSPSLCLLFRLFSFNDLRLRSFFTA